MRKKIELDWKLDSSSDSVMRQEVIVTLEEKQTTQREKGSMIKRKGRSTLRSQTGSLLFIEHVPNKMPSKHRGS